MADEPFQKGLWRDVREDGGGEFKVLVSEEHAMIVGNTVAVMLTLALPRLLVVIKILFPMALASISRMWITVRRKDASSQIAASVHRTGSHGNCDINLEQRRQFESQVDIEGQTRLVAGVQQSLHDATTIPSAAEAVTSQLSAGRIEIRQGKLRRISRILANIKEDPIGAVIVLSLSFLLWALLIGNPIMAIVMTGSLMPDSVGLSKPSHCGIYVPDMWSIRAANSASKSCRTAYEYAQSCYSQQRSGEQCNQYLLARIETLASQNSTCPFKGDICRSGPSSAYTVQTDWVGANKIGLNTRPGFLFRRLATCAPLILGTPVVYKKSSRYYSSIYKPILTDPGGLDVRPQESRGTPSQTPHKQMPWLSLGIVKDIVFGYEVSAWEATLLTEYESGNDQLVSALLPQDQYGEPTIYHFLTSRNIAYSGYSDDPIFPATTPIDFHSDSNVQTLYTNSFAQGRLLGCVERREIRNFNTGDNWVVEAKGGLRDIKTNKILNTTQGFIETSAYGFTDEEKATLNLLAAAMSSASIREAYESGGGGRLNAAERLIGSLSTALDPEQWKLEVDLAFNSSLARIQVNLDAIGRGINPGGRFSNILGNSTIDRAMCNMIKLPTRGWKNIRLSGLVGLTSFSLGLWILTIERKQTIVLIILCRDWIPSMVRGVRNCLNGLSASFLWFRFSNKTGSGMIA